jgi:nucleoside phosphorylase
MRSWKSYLSQFSREKIPCISLGFVLLVMTPESAIHLITALPAEAKPIVARLGLQRRQGECAFPVFEKGRISLLISGVGKLQAAAACGFLHALKACPRQAIWLNIGIAGHADKAIGSPLLASCVRDAASGQHWDRPLNFAAPCDSETLETLDAADFDYQRGGAFDMEASGFCAVAERFSPAERVNCLKIVSDNRQQAGHGLNAAKVRLLISEQLDLIETLLARLSLPVDV